MKNPALLHSIGNFPAVVKRFYLERYAKGCNRGERCGAFVRQGVCEGGHHWVKVLYCGREWCPTCREVLHKRRFARLLPKVLKMKKFGYFVFTIPEEMRAYFSNKEALNELRTYVRRKLKRMFPGARGIMRWHWFGDEDWTKYHPHLNVLVEGLSYLPEDELERIKKDYKAFLEKVTGVSLGEKKVSVRYSYHYDKKKLLHKLKYITRPTFRVNPEFYEPLRPLAEALKGYRNTTLWGRWEKPTEDELERIALAYEGFVLGQKAKGDRRPYELFLLHHNICPLCRRKIIWLKGVSSGGIPAHHENFGDGFYLVKSH
ncbi:TPA: hypothetical protein EYP12_05050 [Candidatus Bipolaricaulota bacterium]|nr:hypothetical protein [Candidatus Bipolaricaulota bacterium]